MTTHRFRTWTHTAALLALALVAACGDGPTAAGTGGSVAAVEVAPGDFAIAVGETHALSATPRAADGAALPGRAVTWSSSDEAVATVSATGVVQAMAAGTAVITARSDTRAGQATVTVQPAPVLWVEITPGGDITLLAGDARQLGTIARGANQAVLPGRAATWASSDTSVVEVSATGIVSARRVGSAIITATVEGKTAQTRVVVPSEIVRVDLDRSTLVLGVGDTREVVATARNANGGVLHRAFTWTTSNSAVVIVDAAGRIRGTGNGSAVVTATSEGRSAVVQVTVGTWHERGLLAVGDSALPATLFTKTVTNAQGVVRTQRFHATGGVLRTLGVNSRFELRVAGWLLTEGSPAVPATYAGEGTFMYDVWDGSMVLHSGAGSFRGRSDGNGKLSVTWRSEPGTAEVVLVFQEQ